MRMSSGAVAAAAGVAAALIAAIALIPQFAGMGREQPLPVTNPTTETTPYSPSPSALGTTPVETPTTTTTTTEVPPPTSAGPTVRRQGEVTLAAGGDAIDLNSTARNWGASEYDYQTDHLVYNATQVWIDRAEIAILDQDATYNRCIEATTYADTTMRPDEIPDRLRVCVRMQSGRYAALAMPSHSYERATFKIIVWDKP